jgi:hypothetical protein
MSINGILSRLDKLPKYYNFVTITDCLDNTSKILIV